jgi:predicted enzyme related to lactoylglutathione lyase
MAEFTSYAQGTPSWVDLATSDLEGAQRFYEALFGWSFDTRSGEWGSYTMCRLRDRFVAGMFRQDPGEQTQGIPPHWLTYLSVDDAEEVAAKATDAGGVVVVPPMDVLDSGRMLAVQDPAGAFVSFWQPKNHIGAGLANEPGTIVWNELQVHDTEAAKAFYTQVLGVGTETVESASGAPYTTFLVDGRSVAGMMAIDRKWGPVPPHWDVYFAVEDTDATSEKAVAAGGRVDVSPMDIPDIGRFAGITDPQGAMFFVLASF